MRDDLPRLLSPPTLPNGLPNPLHLEKAAYLTRARAAAIQVSIANGVSPTRLRLDFPDAASFAPVRVRATVTGQLDLDRAGGSASGRPLDVEASAVAEAAAPATATGSMPTIASGGGYSGPLVYRQGEGMRPDVAAAFDRMAAAASRKGIALLVNSGFRSDAEQAALFAANPDPRMVAPPGSSLHRCATELDLGSESAYAWLAANADRFGFVQRYSWELRPVSKGSAISRALRHLGLPAIVGPIQFRRTVDGRRGIRVHPPGSSSRRGSDLDCPPMESQQHRRTFTFENWPVESEDEFVSYAEWLVGVVRDNSAGDEPGTSVAVLRSGNSEFEMPLAEFRARLDEFPFDDMFSATLIVRAGDGGVSADVSRPGFGLKLADKTVNIAGTDKARVEGVKAQVRQDGERRIEWLKEAEADRAAEAERDRQAETTRQIIEADAKRGRERSQPIKQKPPEEKPPEENAQEPKKPHPSRFKRFINNPWTIGIGATVIGTVIASLIVIAVVGGGN